MKKYYSDETIRNIIDPFFQQYTPYIPKSCKPVYISIFGFCIGLLGCIAVYFSLFLIAFFCISINRLCDALDGILARQRDLESTAGAFIDIVLDFILYSAIPIAFAFENPIQNSIVSVCLVFSFVVSGTSFLAFAIFAKEYGIQNTVYTKKGIYYMSGLVEGTETCIFLALILLFPEFFVIIGTIFTLICLFTGSMRIYTGYSILKDIEG